MLPESVKIEEVPEGVALLLRRDPTHFRKAGRAVVKAGLGVLVTACVLTAVMVLWGPGAVPWQVFLELGVAAFCIGFGVLLIRSADRGSTTRVVVDGLSVSASDRVLWFNQRVVIPRAAIRSFIVEPVASPRHGRARKNGLLKSLCVIRVLLETGKSERFALGYSRDVLSPVADELARLCAPPGAADVLPEEEPPGRTGLYERIPVRLDRPAASLVELEEHPDGITLIVPPGAWSPAIGCLIVFAALFSAAAGVALVITAGKAIARNDLDPNVFGFFGLFLGAVFLLLLGVDLARRRAVLAVVGSRLMVMQAGLLTTRRREWDRSELLDIRAVPRGATADDRLVMQMQIVPRQGKPFKLLTGRDEPELDWIVALLQRSLRVPGAPAPDQPTVEEGGEP